MGEMVIAGKHDFEVDASILEHIILRQAGTVSKAILELVMNAVDAGSKEIKVEIDKDGFLVEDDGRGFSGKDEIVRYFGRFGTPHTKEEDKEKGNTFGRFRMGRGQIMAFSACSWRSSFWEMSVDIKKNGLSYDLIEHSDCFLGCRVSGRFYEAVESFSASEIFSYFRYIDDVDIFFNGEKVNRFPGDEKWDIVTDEFYYRDAKSKGELAVYNMGAFVKNLPSWDYGISGILVSRQPMEVNFARNDIIFSRCRVWSNFVETYKETMRAEEKSGYFRRVNKKDRPWVLSNMVSLSRKICDGYDPSDVSLDEVAGICGYRVFVDNNGKFFSLYDLLSSGCSGIAFEDKKGSRLSELTATLPDGERLFVFGYDERFVFERVDFRSNLLEIVELLLCALKAFTPYVSAGDFSDEQRDAYSLFSRLKREGEAKASDYFPKGFVSDIRSFAKENGMLSGDRLYAPGELSACERIGLEVAEYLSRSIAWWTCDDFSEYIPKREILLGDIESKALAYTDGKEKIVLRRDFFSKYFIKNPNLSFLSNIILHEYCHQEQSKDNDVHGVEFYERFHNAVMKIPFEDIVSKHYSLFYSLVFSEKGFADDFSRSELEEIVASAAKGLRGAAGNKSFLNYDGIKERWVWFYEEGFLSGEDADIFFSSGRKSAAERKKANRLYFLLSFFAIMEDISRESFFMRPATKSDVRNGELFRCSLSVRISGKSIFLPITIPSSDADVFGEKLSLLKDRISKRGSKHEKEEVKLAVHPPRTYFSGEEWERYNDLCDIAERIWFS